MSMASMSMAYGKKNINIYMSIYVYLSLSGYLHVQIFSFIINYPINYM